MATRGSHITLAGACALVGWSVVAFAQPADVECKKTETQPECHARLKCKPNEELEECQKRLLKCTAGEALDACKKRAQSASQGAGNQGNANQAAGQRQGDQGGRDDNGRGRDDGGRRDDGRRGGDDDRRRSDDGGRRSDDGGGSVHRRAAAGGGTPFEANKTFGLGLELGEPTGLTGKYFFSGKSAIDFGLGYIYDYYYYGDGLNIYADYLYHPVSLVSAQAFELPLYIGGGLRYWHFDNYCFMAVCYAGSTIGIRVPVGVSFDMNSVPLDVFIQLVPVLDFVYGDYYNRFGDRTHFGIDLSVGIRYYFK